jgi:hypothetical protein
MTDVPLHEPIHKYEIMIYANMNNITIKLSNKDDLEI